jgi:hypothetical protein
MNPENQHRVVWIDIWRPMETAPKDGTEILVSDNDLISTAFWGGGAWQWSWDRELDYLVPLYWMPLPPLPKDS